MLTFFIHFGLSFRQADHWLASRLFCPSPPPPPLPPHHPPPITFLMVLSLSTIPWSLADVLKPILGISRTDHWSQASFFIKPTRGGGLFISSPFEGGGLNKDQGQWFPYDDFNLKLPTPSPQKSED